LRRPAAIAVMLLWIGACSMPPHLGAFFSRDDRDDATGSISGPGAAPATFTYTDLSAASAATAALLEHDGGSESGPWENPLTGARGTITPLAAAYRDGGIECRDFLASYVQDKAEAWMQGEACRNGFGRWEVREIKPWRR
jgi:surface antigen